MKITDEKVIKMLKKVRSCSLVEQIEGYPDDERDGRSDIEFLADEVSYQVSLYNEDGCDWKDDLQDAKEKLSETRYGKEIPIDARTFRPLHGYWPYDIQRYKDLVNEYNRLVRLLRKLQNMGIYGSWYIA